LEDRGTGSLQSSSSPLPYISLRHNHVCAFITALDFSWDFTRGFGNTDKAPQQIDDEFNYGTGLPILQKRKHLRETF